MYGTYQYFKQHVRQDYLNMSLEDLSELYQKTHEDSVLATAYVKIYGIAKRCLEKFYSLDDDKKTEIVVEKLKQCLEKFRTGKKAKFTTYFYSMIYRKAQDEIALDTDADGNPRDMILACESLDYLQEFGHDASTEMQFTTCEILRDKKLRESELKFCQLVMKNPRKMTVTEIAEELHMSRAGITNMKKRLQEIFKTEWEDLLK